MKNKETQYHLNVLVSNDMKNELNKFAESVGFVNISECVRYAIRKILIEQKKN